VLPIPEVYKVFSHRERESLRSLRTAFFFAMDCLLLRLSQARFESCPRRISLICKSKTVFESASCGRHFDHIISD
jgi:hypothetical protein